ncbi:MAG: helix-turn-helix domain-containing protein [Catenulispora sp.]|nr:helix-turn-helix domain-containing protein [Catenulispora sp.]
MLLRYKYRLYPNAVQREALARGGLVRGVGAVLTGSEQCLPGVLRIGGRQARRSKGRRSGVQNEA